MVTTKGNVTIKPCILVSLHSSVTGGVTYTRKTLDAPELPETIAAPAAPEKAVDRDVERWETTKIVEDKAEHERAEDARKKARGAITKLCIKSAFGLICPVAYESELSEAIESAHAIATGFNDDPTTRYTRVSLFVMRGHVASTDEEAAKAIGDEVRRLVSELLEQRGYTVLSAAQPQDAIAICNAHAGPIELLLTDVVMPQMGGRELAEKTAWIRPAMKVLFMSGYTEEVLAGIGEPGFAFLRKPFTPAVLAHKIREVLEAEPRGLPATAE
jgi:CheY-like chemotaxis protein